MKYFIFYRENDNFDDLLSEKDILKHFSLKLKWHQYLILGSDEICQEYQSYLVLKYGDDLRDKSNIFIDRTPKPFIDYHPDRNRPKKFEKL